MLAPFLQRPLQQPLGASNFHAKERSRPGGPAQPWRCRPISIVGELSQVYERVHSGAADTGDGQLISYPRLG